MEVYRRRRKSITLTDFRETKQVARPMDLRKIKSVTSFLRETFSSPAPCNLPADDTLMVTYSSIM